MCKPNPAKRYPTAEATAAAPGDTTLRHRLRWAASGHLGAHLRGAVDAYFDIVVEQNLERSAYGIGILPFRLRGICDSELHLGPRTLAEAILAAERIERRSNSMNSACRRFPSAGLRSAYPDWGGDGGHSASPQCQKWPVRMQSLLGTARM